MEEARSQAEETQNELRRLRVDAAASEDLVKEAEGRAVQTEQELAAARDAERQLRSELEAVRARLEEGDDELAKRDDQCVQLAQELDDARAEGEAAADVAEQTRLALAVAEEERDAARGAEERLTYELERVVEERDDGMDGYVRLTEQLNDARDELTDAQEQVEAYKEREANNMRGVLTERQDVEARRGSQAGAEEHEDVMSGLEKLKRRLERHLKKIDESPLKRPPSLIDAVAALLDCALDKYDELLEQRPHTPDVEFDDGALDAFDAALKRAAEPHKPSPADTSTQPLADDDYGDAAGDDDGRRSSAGMTISRGRRAGRRASTTDLGDPAAFEHASCDGGRPRNLVQVVRGSFQRRRARGRDPVAPTRLRVEGVLLEAWRTCRREHLRPEVAVVGRRVLVHEVTERAQHVRARRVLDERDLGPQPIDERLQSLRRRRRICPVDLQV